MPDSDKPILSRLPLGPMRTTVYVKPPATNWSSSAARNRAYAQYIMQTALRGRMALGRSMVALAVMLVALSALCGAAEADYPKSPVPTREEFEAIAQKANAGDAESQRYLGIFYANGDIVAQDYAKAAG